jgi:hypothetical protein
MQKLPIPDDWQEENGYILVLACVPDSTLWRALVRGQIHNLTRGRSWDESTGTIKDAQAIGWTIYDSLMTCKLDDIVLAFGTLNETLLAQQETLAAISTALADIKTALDNAPAGEDLEDDLANVWGNLAAINTILGGTVVTPPDPL